jgi:phosphatidate cytidylyltransferase
MGIRIVSSVVALAFAVVVLILADTFVFNLAIAAISVIILFELFTAVKFTQSKFVIGISFIYAALSPFLVENKYSKYNIVVTSVCVFLVFLGYIINHKKLKFEIVFFIIGAMLLIPHAMCCLITIKEKSGLVLVVLSLCGAWFSDTAAYFTGTFLGKKKLCPEISPKKTVEGFVGGVVVTGLLFAIFMLVYVEFIAHSNLHVNYIIVFILGILCSLVGTVGDLVASLIKRQCNIKDYGNIMPGHGGLLDRFDSALFVIPFFCAFTSIFNVLK